MNLYVSNYYPCKNGNFVVHGVVYRKSDDDSIKGIYKSVYTDTSFSSLIPFLVIPSRLHFKWDDSKKLFVCDTDLR